jgi:uncharacterized protein with NRDE domain
MCTLIVLDRIVPGLPLLIASNRDEYLTRAAAPPARMGSPRSKGCAFVAPQDLVAGGTWMGVNERGVFVGLTNRPIEQRRAEARSRGLLVMDALAEREASSVADAMRDLAPGTYNPFNLLCADRSRTFVALVSEERVAVRELQPGVHILCNRDVDDPRSGKIARIAKHLAGVPLDGPFERLFRALAGLLGTHGDPDSPLEHVCVHAPASEYGTRSSAILALGERRWRWWHADGPPCETKYRNYTTLLDDLRQPPHASR